MRPAPTAAVAVGANDIRAFVAIKSSPAFDDRDGPNDGRGWFAEIGPSVCRLISFFLCYRRGDVGANVMDVEVIFERLSQTATFRLDQPSNY